MKSRSISLLQGLSFFQTLTEHILCWNRFSLLSISGRNTNVPLAHVSVTISWLQHYCVFCRSTFSNICTYKWLVRIIIQQFVRWFVAMGSEVASSTYSTDRIHAELGFLTSYWTKARGGPPPKSLQLPVQNWQAYHSQAKFLSLEQHLNLDRFHQLPLQFDEFAGASGHPSICVNIEFVYFLAFTIVWTLGDHRLVL